MDKIDLLHYNRSEKYVKAIKKLYKALIEEVSRLAVSYGVDTSKAFDFSDYPQLKKEVDKLLKKFADNMAHTIDIGQQNEWYLGIKKVSEYLPFNLKRTSEVVAKNTPFVSERVWKYTEQYKGELEMALDLGISRGQSANSLAREIKQYLNEPDKLFRRVRDKHGNLHLSKKAKEYHSGQGIYRSSFKNAQRLARTETNRAYHTAIWNKYQELNFVVGYEVRLSNNPKHCPFCSAMAGKYPKDFKFTGWHPNCRCSTIPILAKDIDDIKEEEIIKDIPENLKNWLGENSEKIDRIKSKPWWIAENKHYTRDKIKDRQQEYERLLKNKDYTDVSFNRKNGGLKSTHRLHSFDPNKGYYEKEVRDILFSNGDKIILTKERADIGEIIKDGQKHIDGYFNDYSCDISTILGEGKNTIKKAFQHSYKKKAEVAILYFPKKEIYSKDRILTGLKMFRGSNNYEFKEILVIVNGKIIDI